MAHILLAAEADQIQDVLFRSSRLRQAVGGSQLLSRFCDKAADALIRNPKSASGNILVKDGGAFRIIFEDNDHKEAEKKTLQFGKNLAELYRRCLDSHLTYAVSGEYENLNDDVQFRKASKEVDEKLRDNKRQGHSPEMPVHLPYIAWCAACGVAIANLRYSPRPDEEPKNYFCSTCYQKEMERKAEIGRIDPEGFQGKLIHNVNVKQIKKLPEQAEDVAQFDSRRNVAYLLADANNMGRFFSQCNQDDMKKLSKQLRNIFYESLASPCSLLLKRIDEISYSPPPPEELLPVLPLILGGDDVFALLPARWAVHFAARFCQQFDKRLREFAEKELSFCKNSSDNVRLPAITAAVVICKSNYPYKLAYREGKKLLDEAKQAAHRAELAGKPGSLLTFDVITGSQIPVQKRPDETGKFIPEFTPYLTTQDPANEHFLSISQLLTLRKNLDELPGKRRAQFERLFERNMIPKDDDDLKDEWLPRFQDTVRRIDRFQHSDGNGTKSWFQKGLEEVGESQDGLWRKVKLPGLGSEEFEGNILPDLLKTWDYAYDLTIEAKKYKG